MGVHLDEYTFNEDQKNINRKNLKISPNDIVILFLGRLSFHAKAHYLPMYLALEKSVRKEYFLTHQTYLKSY